MQIIMKKKPIVIYLIKMTFEKHPSFHVETQNLTFPRRQEVLPADVGQQNNKSFGY